MRHVVAVLTLMLVLPVPTSAQIDLQVPTLDDPALRASLGPWSVSATLGARGIDVRVDDRTASARGTPSPRSPAPTDPGSGSGSSSRSSASAAAVLNTADDYVGVPYVWGGSTPRGFDCSGFVQYVYREHGVNLPRTSRQQAVVGQPVATSLRALRTGDLMFFAANGSRIDHVAIYAGNNEILHSSSSGGGVGYDDFSSTRGTWFVRHHVATRRVLANGYNLVGELTAALRSFTRSDLDPPDRAPRRR